MVGGCAPAICYSDCHCLSEADLFPWHFALPADAAHSTMNEAVAPKLTFSMPPPAQRRNLQDLMVNAFATTATGSPQRRRCTSLND